MNANNVHHPAHGYPNPYAKAACTLPLKLTGSEIILSLLSPMGGPTPRQPGRIRGLLPYEFFELNRWATLFQNSSPAPFSSSPVGRNP